MRYIDDFLNNVNSYPFHMPGHKRNGAMFGALPLDGDITEIDGADNLHAASGIIARSEAEAARLWGAGRSYFLVNGSTCGILAGITALAKRGGRVLCARNCHRSVFHAIELGGLKPVFVMPRYINELGVYGEVCPTDIEAALESDGDIRLVILTSPTYEGVLSDVGAIAAVCHRHGVPLIVDEAHGAHLDLSPCFVGGAVKAGADLVVQSLHKTLPALTQTAILHVNGDMVDISRLEHKLRVFETSSPSYLLMRSAEYAVSAASDTTLFRRWAELLDGFERDVCSLKNINLALRGQNADRTKLVLSGVNGRELCGFLRARGIEAEFATDRYVLALTGAGDSAEGMNLLVQALREADGLLPPLADTAVEAPFSLPTTHCGIEEALDAPSRLVPVGESVGKIAAEYVWAYPPGIPVIIPGEVIPPSFLQSTAAESDSRALPERIKVLC